MDAGIAMIDLDDMKTYNDIYGHVAGDKVLVTLSAAIMSCVRKGDSFSGGCIDGSLLFPFTG